MNTRSNDGLVVDPTERKPLEAWIGSSQTHLDTITAAPCCALADTLDYVTGVFGPGTPVPPLWHWLYFLPRARQSELGADGHPRRGGFLPPVPLPRRMWAGGRLSWDIDNPLVIGDAAERRSTVRSVARKEGRSGPLVFVEVEHVISRSGGTALTEIHDIVYREPAQPGELERRVAVPEAALAGSWSRTVVPDDVLLFRYSALTFNGHRIHYDRRYVTEVEGYPGLIVHGPLIATLLVDLLSSHVLDAETALQTFEFRAVRPISDLNPFTVSGRPAADGRSVNLWAIDHDGWLCMKANATLARRQTA